jgi:hypothetical protein
MNQYDYKILWLKIQQNIMDTTSVIESKKTKNTKNQKQKPKTKNEKEKTKKTLLGLGGGSGEAFVPCVA